MKQTRKRNYRIRKTIQRAAQLMHQGNTSRACEQAQLAVKSIDGYVSDVDMEKLSPAYAKQARNALKIALSPLRA